jgi:spore maturation protein CgeB
MHTQGAELRPIEGMPAELLVVGTRMHYGVGGCMCDELRDRGNDIAFLELSPRWSRNLAHRVARRVLARSAPGNLAVNWFAMRLAAQSAIRYAIVTNGWELRAKTVAAMRRSLAHRGGGIACFLCDDPFNPVHRDKSWLDALLEYTVVVSTKRQVIEDLKALGCGNVKYARFGYHPPIHRPVNSSDFGFRPVDVSFAGNADADRLPVLGGLAEGAPELALSLFGNGWREHLALRHIALPQVVGLEYSAAMRAGTVCPCLVRRANRDGHVMRSFELPAMGAFMLAERTEEHLEIFDEGVHCDYWGSVDELVEKCRWYAKRPQEAASLARAAHELIRSAPNTYGDRALEVIDMIRQAS